MRFGIIGCGLIGSKRAKAIQDAGGTLAAVYDLSGAAAEALAKSAKAERAPDVQSLLAMNLDAVVVATRHGDLAPLTLAAVKAGTHVLVEKPAGSSATEIAEVVSAAAHAKRIVKVGYNHRFHPGFRQARKLFDDGVIGPVMYIRGRYGHGGRVGYEKEWRAQKALSGGGELIDQGSHLIDLAKWFMGKLSLDYAALSTSFWPIDVEDNCFMALRGPQQQMAWLHASWTEWKNIFCFEIMGRDGKLTIDGLGGSYGVERLTLHKMLPQMGPPETTIWEYPFPDMSWTLEVQDFMQAIQTSNRPCGDIQDALENAQLIDAMYNLPAQRRAA